MLFVIYFSTRIKYLAKQKRTLKVRYLSRVCGGAVIRMIYSYFVVMGSLIEQTDVLLA